MTFNDNMMLRAVNGQYCTFHNIFTREFSHTKTNRVFQIDPLSSKKDLKLVSLSDFLDCLIKPIA